MKTYEEHRASINEELKGFGFNVHHHQDRKLNAILEVLTEIRDLLASDQAHKAK